LKGDTAVPENILQKISNSRGLQVLLLCLLVLVTFSPVFKAEYLLFDENFMILENRQIKAPFSLFSLVDIFASFEPNQYTPLSVFSFWVEYNIWGFNSTISHLINLLLHLLCSLAVFFLARQLVENVLLSWFIAAIWAVHPIQVESVAWVLERRNLLYGLFYFASLLAWTQYIKTGRTRHMALASAFMLVSGLSKTLAFFLPFNWMMLDWLKSRSFSLQLFKEKAAGFVLSAIFFGLAFFAAHGEIASDAQGFLNWSMACYNISFYAIKTLLPFNLLPAYEINRFIEGIFTPGPLYLAIFIALAWFVCRGSRQRLFGVLFYFFLILPISGLVVVGYQFYAVLHFLYVAMFGLIFSAILLIAEKARDEQKAVIARAAGVIVLLVFAFMSFQHCVIWKNSENLFTWCLERDPNNRFARGQLAAYYLFIKQSPDEAAPHYRDMIERYPKFQAGYYGMARIFMARNQSAEALEMFDQAVKYNVEVSQIPRDRGYLKLMLNDLSGAEKDFTEALVMKEDNHVRFLRSDSRRRQGDYSGALNDLMIVAENAPGDFSLQLGLFELMIEGGRTLNAFEVFLTVCAQLDANPGAWGHYFEILCTPDFKSVVLRMLPYRSYFVYRLGWYPF
jgi:tetratricopeptide (TPR) repeat protein